MRYIAKKATQKMEGVFRGFEQNSQTATKPKAHSDTVSRKSSKVVGEYIDFEEIE